MPFDQAALIRDGRTALGIELGSTRIKACLVSADDPSLVLAVGDHEWENQLVDDHWTYSLDAVWSGLQDAYAGLVADAESRHGVRPDTYGAIGVSAMMHGYLAFDADRELLVPFRTWRDTTTGAAAAELSREFGVNIPLRWSIAHLYQAVLDAEPHVADVRFLTTLAGYVHWKLTGRFVLGIGDASGMFPIDDATRGYRADLLERFDALATERAPPLREPAARGAPRGGAGRLAHRRRVPRCSTRPGRCVPASCCARRRVTRAPAWSRPTRSRRARATSVREPASSRWSYSSARSRTCTTSSMS